MSQRGIRMRGDKNPVLAVAKYKQDAAEISFLNLKEIDVQLDALAGKVKLQAMVATLIFPGSAAKSCSGSRPMMSIGRPGRTGSDHADWIAALPALLNAPL
jgi:hypothetical protein